MSILLYIFEIPSNIKKNNMIYSCCIYNFEQLEIENNWNHRVSGSIFWRIYKIMDIDGEASIRILGKEYKLQKGHFYLIPAFTRHQSRLSGKFIHKYLHFAIIDNSLSRLLEDFLLPVEIESSSSLDFAIDRISHLCQGFQLPNHNPDKYENNTSYIEWTKRYESLPESTILELDGFLRILLSGFIKKAIRRRHSSNDKLSKALLFITNNISQPITIKHMAGHIGMRAESLIRLFHKEYDITPLQYLLEARINKAKSLLLLSKDSIKEIANKCGFSDPSYFCKAFKQHTSMTPGEFRRGKGECLS